jgi:hypothetical protein
MPKSFIYFLPSDCRTKNFNAFLISLFRAQFVIRILLVSKHLLICVFVQGGSNMTGTNCDLFTHNQSRSYLNHLVSSLFRDVMQCRLLGVTDVLTHPIRSTCKGCS